MTRIQRGDIYIKCPVSCFSKGKGGGGAFGKGSRETDGGGGMN